MGFLDVPRLQLFLLAATVLLLTPGPAVLYIIARSIDQGRRAGLVSVASVEAGNAIHVVAATLGFSALLLSSALAFAVVKYLGAAYLIFLGVRKLVSRDAGHGVEPLERQSYRRIFTQGIVVATLNPKTALFFLAFLPQFIDRSRGNIAGQMLLLGAIFVLLAIISDSMYAMLAGTLGQRLKASSLFTRGERYVTGTVYIGLGLTAAFADARRS